MFTLMYPRLLTMNICKLGFVFVFVFLVKGPEDFFFWSREHAGTIHRISWDYLQ